MIRKPAVAGFFYSDDPDQLNQDLDSYLSLGEDTAPSKALGIISPHAGYLYSGGVAGNLFSSTELTDQFIVLCPKHYAEGDDAAIISAGHWDTPLGSYPINTDLALKLMSAINILEEDPQAHAKEHSLVASYDVRYTTSPVPTCSGIKEVRPNTPKLFSYTFFNFLLRCHRHHLSPLSM